MRFKSAAAVELMEAAFENAVESWRRSRRVEHRLARCFPDIVAIDLNPLIAGPAGAVAVDALVVLGAP
jgi:hypothetical protein